MMIETQTVDLLGVERYPDRAEMGRAAAAAVHEKLVELLARQEEVNMLFAAAPSQNELLTWLCRYTDIPWARVNAFHMDEYVGLSPDAPQRFGNFLKTAIFSHLPFRSVNYLDGGAAQIHDECERYARLLARFPLDMACTGIGENGHIAFNDPHVADFTDPEIVKCVELDERCRLQQVHDGCFGCLDEVPARALTLTIPAIFRADFIVCVVPGASKAQAVRRTLTGPVNETCPASILRRHADAHLYLDSDSAALLGEGAYETLSHS